MDNNIINFNQQVLKKDLEQFSKALFNECNRLRLENEQLKEKLLHLEELLVNANTVTIFK
jgi:regulator of replication initiation timing